MSRRRPGSIKLVTVRGIRIGVDASWFVVLFFVIFLLSQQFREVLSSSDAVAYLTAVAAALLFFASIVLHELGHAWAARRLGIGVTRIDLWFFGGLATLGRDCETPREELKIALAGPVVTLLVTLACLGLAWGIEGAGRLWNAATLTVSGPAAPAFVLISFVGLLNASLLIFNLLPTLPLDGGRVARALIWRRTGDKVAATRVAARGGVWLGWLCGGLGVYLFAVGYLAGLWLVAMAFVFAQASRAAVSQTVFSERIDGVRVADIMDTEPVSVPDGISLDRALDEYFLRYRWPWFPVVDSVGRYLGLVREEQVRDGGALTVGAVLERADDASVQADASLETLLASEPLRRLGSLAAIDERGVLRGMVTLEQARRAVSTAFAGPRPG